MNEKIIVVFRKFKDLGDIIALFPAEINYPNGLCESYQHIGQHSSADYGYCIAKSKPAKPEEYSSLKRELEGLGYNLSIKKKYVQK